MTQWQDCEPYPEPSEEPFWNHARRVSIQLDGAYSFKIDHNLNTQNLNVRVINPVGVTLTKYTWKALNNSQITIDFPVVVRKVHLIITEML